MGRHAPWLDADDSQGPQTVVPSTSPALTGSLNFHVHAGAENTARKLLDLPGDLQLRKLTLSWATYTFDHTLFISASAPIWTAIWKRLPSFRTTQALFSEPLAFLEYNLEHLESFTPHYTTIHHAFASLPTLLVF